MGREPVVEIEDDPGEEAGFADAEQEAQHIEHGAGLDVEERRQGRGEGHGHRHHGPGDHDPGDPEARAEAVQQQVAGNFEDEIAPEEHAGAQGVDSVAELQVAEHVELGESDIDPVEIGRDVAQQQDGQRTQDDLAVEPVLAGEVRSASGGVRVFWNSLHGANP
ncbi:hypothetical protein D3C78_1441630 [compost metagenome]